MDKIEQLKGPRLENWRGRLSEELDRQKQAPLIWGEDDCVVGFAFKVIEALMGVDLSGPYRGTYHSEDEAVERVKAMGKRSLRTAMRLYLPEQHPSEARVGDLGLIQTDGKLGMSFCMFDSSMILVRTAEGHGVRPRQDAFMSFKVGD